MREYFYTRLLCPQSNAADILKRLACTVDVSWRIVYQQVDIVMIARKRSIEAIDPVPARDGVSHPGRVERGNDRTQ